MTDSQFQRAENEEIAERRYDLFQKAKKMVGDPTSQRLAVIVQNPNCITPEALLDLKSRAKGIRRRLENYVSEIEKLGVDAGQLGEVGPKLFIATQGDHVRGKFQGLRPALVRGERGSHAVDLMDLDLDDEEDQEKALNALREAKKEFKYS